MEKQLRPTAALAETTETRRDGQVMEVQLRHEETTETCGKMTVNQDLHKKICKDKRHLILAETRGTRETCKENETCRDSLRRHLQRQPRLEERHLRPAEIYET